MENRSILGSPDKPWNSPYTQQGDCIIKKCGKHGVFEKEWKEIPEGAKDIPGNLVLKGTSNSHALYGGKFRLSELNGVTFLRVTEPTILDHVRDTKTQAHAEHHAQWIPAGDYFVDGVMEYDHVREESRQAID